MFFDKDRVQLLGLFDFLPFSDEEVDSNRTLIDYRLTVRDLQVAYIQNAILEMLSGQSQFGSPTAISDYLSQNGIGDILGPSLAGEPDSKISNRLNDVLISNEALQSSIRNLLAAKVDPVLLGSKASSYWSGTGLENIPTESDLSDFFADYCNIVGTTNTQERFNNTSLSKMYLQLFIDTQSSLNHYYPRMLDIEFISSDDINRETNVNSFLCNTGLNDDGSTAGIESLIESLSIKPDLSSNYGSRVGDYGVMLKSFPPSPFTIVDPTQISVINQKFNIGNDPEVNLAALIQIFSREIAASKGLTDYQLSTLSGVSKVEYAENSNNFDLDLNAYGNYALELKLVSDTDYDTLTSNTFLDTAFPAVTNTTSGGVTATGTTGAGLGGTPSGLGGSSSPSLGGPGTGRGIPTPSSPVGSGPVPGAITIPYTDANISNIVKLSKNYSPILSYEGSDISVTTTTAINYQSGISGLIKPVFENGYRASLLTDPASLELNPLFNSIANFEPKINEIIDNHIQFIKDMTAIDEEGSVDAVNFYDLLLDKLIILFTNLNDASFTSGVIGTTAIGATFKEYSGSEYKDNRFLNLGGIIELMKQADKYPVLDATLSRWFWHYFNGWFNGGIAGIASTLSIKPDIGEKNYENTTNSVDFLSANTVSSGGVFLSDGANEVKNAINIVSALEGTLVSDLDSNPNLIGIAKPIARDVATTFKKDATGGSVTLAIDASNYNPFYQMSKFVVEIDQLANVTTNYWRNIVLSDGSEIKGTRKGALDIKSMCFFVYKIFQKAFLLTNVTDSRFINDPFVSQDTFEVGYQGNIGDLVNYLQEVKDSLRDETTSVSTPPEFPSFQLTKEKLKEEELNLRKFIAYVNQAKLSESKAILDKLFTTLSVLKNISATQTSALIGAEHELSILPSVNSGQAKLVDVSKSRLLPNIKFLIDNISATYPDSLLPKNEILTAGTKNALLNLMNDQRLKNTGDNEFKPKNSKILMCGLPAGFIDEMRFPKITVQDISGEYYASQNYGDNASIVNVKINKNDVMIQGVNFQSIKLTFDSGLIVAPNGFDECTFNEGSPSLLEEIINNRIRFKILNTNALTSTGVGGAGSAGTIIGTASSEATGYQDSNGDGLYEYGVTYSELVSNPKYSEITEDQLQAILLNCATSELLKIYVQIIVGLKLGEENFVANDVFKRQLIDESLEINGSTRISSVLNAMSNITNLNLALDPLITEQLVIDSGLRIRNQTSVGTGPSLATGIDPYSDLRNFALPSDPVALAAGAEVSQVQQTSQLFSSAFFKPSSLIGECITPKMFESIFFVIVDPDEFVINESLTDVGLLTTLESLGLAERSQNDFKLRIVRTEETNSNSANLNEYFVSCNIPNVTEIKTLEEFSESSGRPTEPTRR